MTDLKKNFNISAILVMIFYIPIFLIDKPFTDDYARNIRGYFGWSGDGRPLADLFIYIINFGSTLTDTSPLSSILSVIVCASTCAIISYKVMGRSNISSVAASCALVVSPFFFHNALYHYDFFTMSFSLFFCVVPFLLLERNYIAGNMLVFICMISVLCLYQASFPLFFTCLMLMFIARRVDGFNYFYPCLSAGVALVIYQLFIGPEFINGDYVVNHATPVSLDKNGLKEAIENIKGLAIYLHKLVTPIWAVVYFPAIIFASAGIFSQIKSRGLGAKSLFYFSCISFGMALSCLMFFLTKDPAYYPRVMIGFNSITMLILCVCSLTSWRSSLLPACAILLAFIFNLSVVTNLINYTKSMYRFESQTAQAMKADMIALGTTSPLVIHGYPPTTQIAARINARYPFAQDIIHPDLGWSITRMYAEIEAPFFKAEKGSYRGKPEEVCGKVEKPWNGIYTITKIGNLYHAVFRKEDCI